MPRPAFVPSELTSGPFTRTQARLQGLTDDQLRGSTWTRMGPNVFAAQTIAEAHNVRLRAALLRLPDGAVFSGRTAGWLHGLDVEPCAPIEVTIPTARRINRRAGMAVHRSARVETSVARGFPVTSRLQTVVDLIRRSSLIEGVSVLDAALHRRMVTVDQLERWAANNAGQRGIAVVRRAFELAEPATESPMETHLRLLLVLAGLPRPRVQPTIRDELGIFIARPDLFYPIHRLAIEYDGATHKDRIAPDNRRQNRLLEAGYRILRFTASDVLGNPSAVVSLVRKAISRPLVHAEQ